jgi:prophage antirepressor-like protein
MTQFQTFHHTDFGFKLQCVCVEGDAWFRADDAAASLGYTDTLEAISGFDNDDAKTLRELIPGMTVDRMADFRAPWVIFISVYGICELVQKSQHQEAHNFRRWFWSDIIKGLRKMANPHLEGCSDNEEEKEEEEEEEEAEEEDGNEEKPFGKEEEEEDEEEWYDFSTNRDPKYWLRKFNKTALMKECDKRGVIINNPMMTLNVRIIEVLIAADTI